MEGAYLRGCLIEDLRYWSKTGNESEMVTLTKFILNSAFKLTFQFHFHYTMYIHKEDIYALQYVPTCISDKRVEDVLQYSLCTYTAS